jgi:hypothetical protein
MIGVRSTGATTVSAPVDDLAIMAEGEPPWCGPG